MFFISNETIKMFLKTMKKKENKHRKIALLARSKFNSIEKIFKALTDSDLSHDKFTLVVDEEQNYFKQKESIRVKGNQHSNI